MPSPNDLMADSKPVLDTSGKDLNQLLLECYNVANDDQRMRQALRDSAVAVGFDQLRKTYPQRREYSYFSVYANSVYWPQLNTLGFSGE